MRLVTSAGWPELDFGLAKVALGDSAPAEETPESWMLGGLFFG